MKVVLFSLFLHIGSSLSYRAPAIFLNHGPGSRPYFERDNPDLRPLIENWQGTTRLSLTGGQSPRAILVVSAHWEAAEVTVSDYDSPPALFNDLGPTYVSFLNSLPSLAFTTQIPSFSRLSGPRRQAGFPIGV